MVELKDIPMGTILEDWDHEGVRCLIIRGSSALCAYLGVPIGHPLAGFAADTLLIKVHGGCFNFAAAGGEERPEDREAGFHRPEGWYWFGWSYDCWDDLKIGESREQNPDGQVWTLEAVRSEIHDAAYHFVKLRALAEELSMRALGWRRAISAERKGEAA